MKASEPGRLLPTVSAFGVVQIVSWGTLYYSIAVLASPVAMSLGLQDVELFTAFSLGLLVSGILAPLTGRWIDRFGGRWVMSAGSFFAFVSCVLLATSDERLQVYAGWLMAGLAMSTTLYDAAFASLRRLFSDTEYRRAVTILTIFGGLASTVFWPLSDLLNHLFGWRWTFGIFAALHIGGMLVHLRSPDGNSSDAEPLEKPLRRHSSYRHARYLVLAIGFACAAFSFSAMSTFAVRILSANGLDRGMVLWIVSLIGPMQVAGRLLEYVSARRVSIQRMGTVAHILFVVGLLLVFAANNLSLGILFAVVYGLSNGAMTVVRGTIPVFMLSHLPPGQLLGGLALPSALSRAAAPAAFAFFAGLGGNYTLPMMLCVFLGITALGCYLWATRPPIPRA